MFSFLLFLLLKREMKNGRESFHSHAGSPQKREVMDCFRHYKDSEDSAQAPTAGIVRWLANED